MEVVADEIVSRHRNQQDSLRGSVNIGIGLKNLSDVAPSAFDADVHASNPMEFGDSRDLDIHVPSNTDNESVSFEIHACFFMLNNMLQAIPSMIVDLGDFDFDEVFSSWVVGSASRSKMVGASGKCSRNRDSVLENHSRSMIAAGIESLSLAD